jgi:hypothetical protein
MILNVFAAHVIQLGYLTRDVHVKTDGGGRDKY